MFKIEVITMWYNESFLAPFFLEHYKFADVIHLLSLQRYLRILGTIWSIISLIEPQYIVCIQVNGVVGLYDEDTADNTLEIVSKYENVEVIPFRFPDMMDDIIKVEKTNNLYKTLNCDWAIIADADEFVFPLPLGRDIREALEQEEDYDLIYTQLWQVYRHRADADLNFTLPAVPQRRHGDPNVTEGINALYVKPIIVRPSAGVEWQPGCHAITKKKRIARVWQKITGNNPNVSPRRLYGTHWAMADPDFAVERRIKGRKARQSRVNISNKLTLHNHHVTEEQIRNECRQHLDDPLLF
ncbi:MAG: hypothetical protein Q7J31_18845 [Syntrophales bacterium]|uniref:hypothetical protein n=1 Tax=Candidatus Wunengus sp. YC61 TaxID=3367698 RepID=UPI0027187B37|nr:hypothetical protein [Syntrophales bacterium]